MPIDDIKLILQGADKALNTEKLQNTEKYPHCNGAYEGILPKVGKHLEADYNKAEELLGYLKDKNPEQNQLISVVEEYQKLKLDMAKGILILQRGLEVKGKGEKKNALSYTFSNGEVVTTNNWTHEDMSLTERLENIQTKLDSRKEAINKALGTLKIEGKSLTSIQNFNKEQLLDVAKAIESLGYNNNDTKTLFVNNHTKGKSFGAAV